MFEIHTYSSNKYSRTDEPILFLLIGTQEKQDLIVFVLSMNYTCTVLNVFKPSQLSYKLASVCVWLRKI